MALGSISRNGGVETRPWTRLRCPAPPRGTDEWGGAIPAPQDNRDPKQTRRRLLRAAGELMDSRGEAGVRVSDVAVAAGYSVGTIYVHFRDREALIAAVHAQRFDAVSRQIVTGAQEVLDVALDRERSFDTILDLVILPDDQRYRAPRWGRLRAIAACRDDPALAEVVDRALRDIDDTLVELFDRAKARGLVRDDVSSRSLSLFTQALEIGFVLSDARDGTPPSAREWRRLMSVVIGALQPPDDVQGSES